MLEDIEGGLLAYDGDKGAARLTKKGVDFIRSFVKTSKEPPTKLSIGGLVVMARLAQTTGPKYSYADLVPNGAIESGAPATEMPTAVIKIREQLKKEWGGKQPA